MTLQDQTSKSIMVTNEELEDEQVINSIINATPPPSPTTRIHRVSKMVKESKDYEMCYAPRVVSIGPYHFGNPKLEMVEKLKPIFTMKFLSANHETLRILYKKLGEPKMVQELRNFYEENSTTMFCDKVFTKMMLQDACFILYYVQFIFGGEYKSVRELKSHQIVFAHQDMFLMENQIPYKVLSVVIDLLKMDCFSKNTEFLYGNILVSDRRKRSWLEPILRMKNDQRYRKNNEQAPMGTEPDHILHLLHRTLTKKVETPRNDSSPEKGNRCTFRNVNELVDVGIHFKPSDTTSLAHIEFVKGRWGSANVKLPQINVDDSTKPIFLNLIAYEMCSNEGYDAGVTSYVCLLDSLIDHPEDVKTLRKARVLENSLGSDKEVAKLFNEIGTDLVPNNLAYLEAKNMIQKHYVSRSNTLFLQLKHEYFKSPWAILAVLGALIALFLASVQAYYTVWSPKGECDDLCMFLRKNHHL